MPIQRKMQFFGGASECGNICLAKETLSFWIQWSLMFIAKLFYSLSSFGEWITESDILIVKCICDIWCCSLPRPVTVWNAQIRGNSEQEKSLKSQKAEARFEKAISHEHVFPEPTNQLPLSHTHTHTHTQQLLSEPQTLETGRWQYCFIKLLLA